MWKYCSEDFDTISLHDNIIDSVEDKENIIINFLDGFDVIANNSENKTGRHKHTSAGIIELVDGKLIEAVFDNSPACSSKQDKLLINELKSIEVLESENDKRANEFMIYGIIGKGFCEVKFSCSKVLIRWNEYSGDAWFQDWPSKN